MKNLDIYTLLEAIMQQADPAKARTSTRYFKTGPGEYAQGDQFLGLRMGEQRRLAKIYQFLVFEDLAKLLSSPYHEIRMIGGLILVNKFKNAKTRVDKTLIYDFLLKHLDALNNWDLVDVIVPHTLGAYLLQFPILESQLYLWAKSPNLWRRRISLLATWPQIKQGKFEILFQIAEIFLKDKEDLIHKATGWMLREVGKQECQALEDFLEKHASDMPRTMLRYAIEKFPPDIRQNYLKRPRTLQ